MKFCVDLDKLVKFTCCSSCHSDDDELGIDMSNKNFRGGEYYVCCAGVLAIELELNNLEHSEADVRKCYEYR
uniref:Uncharacterized protein n=1 Tax=viral metagenome TaxID=1070528 RepID=A0A6M3IHE6_9ZZZZ